MFSFNQLACLEKDYKKKKKIILVSWRIVTITTQGTSK